MARFSGQIHSAKFIDREEKVIEVLYGEDQKSLTAFNVPVDYNSPVFMDLIEEVTIEQIQDQTRIYYENIEYNYNTLIHNQAKKLLDQWIVNVQKDLDKQDEERYEAFEKYKEEQIAEMYARIDEVHNEKQKEIDLQVEQRYEEAERYKAEQLEILQAELDLQVEKRLEQGFKDVDDYREEQLSIMQAELDKQVEQRYGEVDEYRSSQMNILQAELDEQVQQRYKEADKYKESQIDKLKADLKDKFNINPSAPTITTDNVIKFLFEKEEDEDTVFKTKLAIFNKPEVKNNENRELKMKIRKAKTIPELFAAYQECIT